MRVWCEGMKEDSSTNGIGINRFKEMIGKLNYDNLILSESGTLFIQFQPIKNDKVKAENLKNWLWNKINDEMIPKYNKEFNIDLISKSFPNHIEISNMNKLPEIKIKKFFNLFKWIHERL